MKTVKFFTLGCKVNQYDTQSIRERFLSRGFREANHPDTADIYVINTCTVTASADQKSRNIIRQCIRENKSAKIIVTGCMAEDPGFTSRVEGVHYVIRKRFFPEGIRDFSGRTRAFLKVQDGCNNFCSYCAVPLARGRSRSRALKEIITEAGLLAEKGFKEIVLTGICLGSYGKDLSGKKISIVHIIKALESLSGISRIRLSSIEAGDVSGTLISHMKRSEKLCPHFHIPVQSGDDTILKKMNRRYTRAQYLKLIQRIKREIPGVSITTDVMVGFPGETRRNFLNTIELIKKILPLRTHVFPYSPRANTQSSLIQTGYSCEELKLRLDELSRVARECSVKFRSECVGKTTDVLLESREPAHPGFWQGYTGSYIRVIVKMQGNNANYLLPVKLSGLCGDGMKGIACSGVKKHKN